MLKYLHSSFLNRVLSNHEVGERKSREPESEAKSVYRDELSKKSACKKRERNIYKEAGKESSKIRVKVRMTKMEAERLLAKCKEGGGVLEFRDVARELAQIPSGRIDVVSLGEEGLRLQSIPEE